MNKIVLAVDFDGTLAELGYPALGDPKPNASKVMKRLVEEGAHIIIWTCRQGIDVDKIRDWCILHDVPYHQINEHHPRLLEIYQNDTRKVCADIYIDDRCLFGLPDDWEEIYQLIKQRVSELHSKCLNYE